MMVTTDWEGKVFEIVYAKSDVAELDSFANVGKNFTN